MDASVQVLLWAAAEVQKSPKQIGEANYRFFANKNALMLSNLRQNDICDIFVL